MNMHRYKIIAGKFAGQIVEGFQIGFTSYPDQIKRENLSPAQVTYLYENNKDGFWVPALNEKVEFENRLTSTSVGVVADYGNVQDLVVPFDKYNNEIFVGDHLFVASKNAVRRAVVTKIAEKATFASYGIILRKLTVKDLDNGQVLTINESRDTIKVAN